MTSCGVAQRTRRAPDASDCGPRTDSLADSPGSQYTLILPASKSVPKRCFKKDSGATTCRLRREVGVRIPDDPICAVNPPPLRLLPPLPTLCPVGPCLAAAKVQSRVACGLYHPNAVRAGELLAMVLVEDLPNPPLLSRHRRRCWSGARTRCWQPAYARTRSETRRGSCWIRRACCASTRRAGWRLSSTAARARRRCPRCVCHPCGILSCGLCARVVCKVRARACYQACYRASPARDGLPCTCFPPAQLRYAIWKGVGDGGE